MISIIAVSLLLAPNPECEKLSDLRAEICGVSATSPYCQVVTEKLNECLFKETER